MIMETIQTINLGTIPRRVKLTILLIAIIGTIVLSVGFGRAYGDYIVGLGIWRWLGLFMVCVVATIPLHEGLHGLFFWIFGGDVRFGAKLKTPFGPVFWATSDKLFSKRQFRMISLAPQILTLTLILIIASAELPALWEIGLLIVAIGNLCGGAFDIYISCILGRFPVDSMFRDRQDGLQVYVK